MSRAKEVLPFVDQYITCNDILIEPIHQITFDKLCWIGFIATLTGFATKSYVCAGVVGVVGFEAIRNYYKALYPVKLSSIWEQLTRPDQLKFVSSMLYYAGYGYDFNVDEFKKIPNYNLNTLIGYGYHQLGYRSVTTQKN